MNIQYATLSESGPRPENQDAVLALLDGPGVGMFAVADGLGGHNAGRLASETAVSILESNPTAVDLSAVFREIHRTLKGLQATKNELYGMATTATAVQIVGKTMIGAHCGDTRCSVQRKNGIQKLTIEHTEAQRLFDAGKLTKEEFLKYPRRNILDRALGAEKDPEIDKFSFDLELGDKVVITSDGVHEIIFQKEMMDIVMKCFSAEEMISRIGSEMTRRRATDNYSAVCILVS